MSHPKGGEACDGDVGDVKGELPLDDEIDGDEYCTRTWYSDEIAHCDVEAKWYLFVR